MKSVHSADTSTKGIVGSTRTQIISRLRKATLYADSLVQILQDRTTTKATSTDVLEANAYSCLVLGALYFEKQKWENCIGHYSLCRVVYAALAPLTRKDTYKDLLSGTVDPSIRYAAYHSKYPRTKAISSIAVENFPSSRHNLRSDIEAIHPAAFKIEEASASQKETKAGSKEGPQEITWRRRKVHIEDAAISQALAGAGSAQANLVAFLSESSSEDTPSAEVAAAYDDVILASQEVVDATKMAIDELAGEGVDQGDQRMQSLQVTRTAVNYTLVGWRVGRNRALCGPRDGAIFEPEKAKSPRKPRKDGKQWTPKEEGAGKKSARLRERVALYDATIQSLDGVKALPGVAGDAEFMQELQFKRQYFQALK